MLLNDKPFEPTESLLPCLISYSEKLGGSHFSISFLASLFSSGSKVLFLTAYPMATDNFLNQVGEGSIVQVKEEKDLHENKDTQAILIESGNEGLFLKTIELLDDLDERVVFVKNMEVFGEEVIKKCLGFKKVILSGDLDKSDIAEQICAKSFESTILFNQPAIDIGIKVPELQKYEGYLEIDGGEKGIVTASMN